MPWEKNGTPNTLNVTGDTLSVDDLTAQDTSVLLCHALNSGTIDTNITFDDDTGSNYAIRVSFDGGADSTAVNQTSILTGGDAADGFHVYYTVNLADQEKLLLGDKVDLSSTGAGTAPSRREQTGKWANTVDQFTSVEFSNAGGGSFVADSNLSVLSDVATIPETIGGWVELGRTTLGVAGDTITVSGLADKRYYMVLQSITRSGGLSPDGTRLGNGSADSGNNYATRYSVNGTADIPNTNNNQGIDYTPSVSNDDSFAVQYITNLSANEKLWIKQRVGRQAVGAGTAPNRSENAAKWVNTSNPLDVFQTTNVADIGNYEAGSQVVVLGWDPDDIHTGNFWEELDSVTLSSSSSTISSAGITPKKYNWVQIYCPGYTSGNQGFRLGSTAIDSGTNYSERRSKNGVADLTSTGLTGIRAQDDTGDTFWYCNLFFINNASQEKLVTGHTIAGDPGAANAPNRLEFAGKWDNTSNQADRLQFFSFAGTMDADTTLRWWGAD